ncbi:ABC transporter permease subunit [Tenggerimyces flavus]|uniref:ABC transporter permease subunit n=1 Tax=Tenggerimyces flavus TaxID=1708749 RepID=A0ABV7YFZ6_9ACTN|nr:ABC transporter permease subunit [Tenggerimyces flavus]MBM7789277.1 ABC-2 type transport system permease protein [Tenggerimyces flavus]
MNATIASLTASVVLGKRRALFLFILPGLLIAMAVGIRVAAGADSSIAATVLQTFAVGTVVPLLGLIAGTGVIGSEIDDGSIVYVLAKPIPRPMIVLTKLLVAVGTLVVFAAVPVLIAGVVLAGLTDGIAVAFTVGALLASIAYAALFLLLAVLTRHAVVVGLLYALIWESLVGSFVPGARTLSIQQWAMSLTDRLVSGDAGATIEATVQPLVAAILLLVVTVGATWFAGQRLRSLTLTDAE